MFVDAERNRQAAQRKLESPVLALGGWRDALLPFLAKHQ